MSNLIPFEGNKVAAIDLASMFGIAPIAEKRERVPAVTIGGKQFSTVDTEGEAVIIKDPVTKLPVQTLGVSIINMTPNRSRSYFVNGYNPLSPEAPRCYSVDGAHPASDVKLPESTSCANCTRSVKGSKPTETNINGVSCHQSKTIAILPSGKPNVPVMIMRLPITTLWDGDTKNVATNEADGWYSFDDYVKYLAKNNVQHPIQVETTLRFDSSVVYPKLLFKVSGILAPEDLNAVGARANTEETRKALALDKIVAAAPAAAQIAKPAAAPAAPAAAMIVPSTPITQAVATAAPAAPALAAAIENPWGD